MGIVWGKIPRRALWEIPWEVLIDIGMIALTEVVAASKPLRKLRISIVMLIWMVGRWEVLSVETRARSVLTWEAALSVARAIAITTSAVVSIVAPSTAVSTVAHVAIAVIPWAPGLAIGISRIVPVAV